MLIPIDEVVHIPDGCLHDPSTGGISDADSTPTFSVFEEATDTPILADQSMTKRTSLTGDYRGTFTASAANGFEAGKWYNVVATGIVGGVTGKKTVLHFRCAPAEASAGVPMVQVSAVTAGAIAAASFAANALDAVWSTATRVLTAGTNLSIPSAATIAAAVWDYLTSAATTAGSLGKLLVDNVNATISSRLATSGYTTPPTAVQNRTEMDSNSTKLASIDTKTTNLPSDPADESLIIAATDALATAIAALNNISAAQVLTQVNAALDTTLSATIPADGTRPTLRQAAYMANQFLLERTVSGTTVTVKNPDGTTLMTLTLGDAVSPASVTRAT